MTLGNIKPEEAARGTQSFDLWGEPGGIKGMAGIYQEKATKYEQTEKEMVYLTYKAVEGPVSKFNRGPVDKRPQDRVN